MPLPHAKAARQADPDGLGALIVRARLLIRSAAVAQLQEKGLKQFWWGVVRHIAAAGPSTQKDIADATGHHPAGISRILDEMEAEGLVARTRDSEDRRKLRVALTPGGERWFQEANPLVRSGTEEVLAPLDETERRTLAALLRKLLEGNGLTP